MSDQTQHLKLCEAEKYAGIALRGAHFWADDPKIKAALERAQYLLSEVREAAYFLADPGCPESIRQSAKERLEQAIIFCK